jgi:type I restriction enzyme S subunit
MSKWEEKQLGSVCSEIFSGGTPSTLYPEYWNGEIPWLSSGETSRRYIYNTEKTITELGAQNSSTRLAKNGDIVIACAGQGKTRGQVSTIKRDMYINQSVIAIRGDSKNADTDFIYYNLLLRYDELRYLSDASSTRGSITTEMLKKLKIILPDLPTQQRIADILSAYDDLIENNNKRIALLEKAAQELYKEWFVRFRFPGHETTRFVNGLPEGWEVKRMNDFCYVTDGTHDTPKPVDNGVPLITGRCIKNGYVDFNAAYSISFEDHEKIKKRSGLKTGDILLSNIGTVGNTCRVIYDREFSVKNVIIFKPDSDLISHYLYYLLISQSAQDIFAAQTNGASQQFVGLTFMRRFKILVPSDDVLTAFSKKVESLLKHKDNLFAQNQNLAKQRDLLLPRLMSGKLEV